MASADDSNFGIDLLLESQKLNIQSGNDVLVVLCHWILCRNGLRNVGIGSSSEITEDEHGSELLPEGWNEETNYKLRYILNKQLYVLQCNEVDGSLLINLLDKSSLKTTSLFVDTGKLVKAVKGATLSDYVDGSDSLIKRITDEVVNPLIKKTEDKTSSETQTSTESQQSPLLVEPHRSNFPPHQFYDPARERFRDPLRDIGRGDLDPFGQGGGMIFQPPPFGPLGGFGPLGPRRPFGIPPGARYDPINPNGRTDPDADHFPPPGMPPPGYDDMFM